MNIYCYDPVRTAVDYKKTFINFARKLLYSEEMKVKKYYFLATKYNKEQSENELFIIFTDYEPTNNIVYGKTIVDENNRFSTSISSLLQKSTYKNTSMVENINIEVDDEDENAIAYKLVL